MLSSAAGLVPRRWSLAFAAVLLGSPVLAPVPVGVGRWTTGGPHGSAGSIGPIVVDPASGAVYAVVFPPGGEIVFKTTDSGGHWNALTAQPDSSVAYALAVDPKQTGHLLAANTSGIARTVDGGNTWSEVSNDTNIFQIFFDPSRANVAFAASRSVLYRSLDDGASWAALHLPIASEDDIAALAVAIDGTLFVALSFSLLRSSDEGESWSPRVFPAPQNSLSSLYADPVASGTLYAATGAGLFRSADGGSSWSLRGRGFPSALAIDPRDAATLYAGSNGGFWKSTDAGVTWKMLATPFPPKVWVSSLAIDPRNSVLWAGTVDDGVFQSPDGGANWTYGDGDLPGPQVAAIAVDPTAPATMYAGTQSRSNDGVSRLQRSDDAGKSWAPILTESGVGITALAISPVSPKTVYAGELLCFGRFGYCAGGISRTTDGGLSWSALDFGGGVTRIAIDPKNSKVLYASGLADVSFGVGFGSKSSDGGSTWTSLSGGFPAGQVSAWAIDPLPAETIYVGTCERGLFPGTEIGVYASSDGGATWTVRNEGLTDRCVLSLARDSGTPGTLYAGTETGIFRSIDRGMSWSATGFSKDARALAVNPRDPTVLFVGTGQSGVFRSLDGGATWASFNEGLRNLEVHALAIDLEGAYLHAATAGGVFDLRLRRLTRVVEPRR